MRTLHFKGPKAVTIKEIHSQSRARWTASTMCISNKSRAAEGPPLEALFNGGEGIRRSCEDFLRATPLFQQPGVAMTVNVSDSGSYRLEHVLEWLETALCRRSSAD